MLIAEECWFWLYCAFIWLLLSTGTSVMSVCRSGTGVHCGPTVHCSADLSLWLDSPWHQSMSTYSEPFFSSSTWKRGGVWMCKLGVISEEWLKIEVKLLLSANRKSCMPRWLAQQLTDDLEWPWVAVSCIARYLCDVCSRYVIVLRKTMPLAGCQHRWRWWRVNLSS